MFECIIVSESRCKRGGTYRLDEIAGEAGRLQDRQLVALGRADQRDTFWDAELGEVAARNIEDSIG